MYSMEMEDDQQLPPTSSSHLGFPQEKKNMRDSDKSGGENCEIETISREKANWSKPREGRTDGHMRETDGFEKNRGRR